jgi:hypothetical protein
VRALLVLLASLTLSGCSFPFAGSSSSIVPPGGRLERVWHVPAGTGSAEDVVGWSRRGCPLFKGTPAGRCYALTVSRRGRHTTLFSHSPFPFLATSVRTADVTADGHEDLLVTIECNACNHAVSAAAVYADVGDRMRRIYGNGFFDWSGGRGTVGVPGRQIVETAWGARRGMVWFDEPHYGPHSSMCCPDYRVQTFMRWDGSSLRTVKTRKVSAEHDNFLGQRPVPAP